MRVTLNGADRDLADTSTLADLVAEAGAGGRGSAVAVDGVVVPRGEWATRPLHEGAAVELVTAVQGG